MKIKTLEHLSDFLAQEIAWRKKELSDLLLLIKTNKNSHILNSLLRSGIPVLYAHWEGYIKVCATAYLTYIASQRLNYNQLSTTFIAVALRKRFSDSEKSNKIKQYIEITDFFLSGLSERCVVPYESAINTKANLNSEVLQDVLATIGLDYSPYRSKQKIIDEKLLKARNEIAHGQFLLINIDSYIELHNEVINLLGMVKDQIENAATLKSFQRAII